MKCVTCHYNKTNDNNKCGDPKATFTASHVCGMLNCGEH